MSKVRENRDKIMFDNVFEVIVIDKDTGKVKQYVKVKNALMQGFASFWASKIFTGTANTNNISAFNIGFNVFNLFTSAKSYIKSLTGSWGGQTDTGSAVQNVLTVTDSSTDTYTVAYVGATQSSNNAYGATQWFVVQLPSPVSKGSTDVITYRWTFQIPYQVPP
jgi:hypothetical protein